VMKEDEKQKRADGVNPAKIERERGEDTQDMACLRISNKRYAKDAGLEERLSAADREMLRKMGILV
jgi:hypothetical protein